MTLWRYRSRPVTLLEQLLDDMTIGDQGMRSMPQADADGYTIRLALPGVAPDAIDLSIDGRTLSVTVDGRTDEDREEGSYQGAMSGRRQWAWALPEGVDAEKIEASTEYGMLTIRVPKSASAKPRRIEVTGTSGARRVGPGTDEKAREQTEPKKVGAGR
jgi:HSP20 family protein